MAHNAWQLYYAAFGCSISRTLWVLVCGEQFTYLKESNRLEPTQPVMRARWNALVFRTTQRKGCCNLH